MTTADRVRAQLKECRVEEHVPAPGPRGQRECQCGQIPLTDDARRWRNIGLLTTTDRNALRSEIDEMFKCLAMQPENELQDEIIDAVVKRVEANVRITRST